MEGGASGERQNKKGGSAATTTHIHVHTYTQWMHHAPDDRIDIDFPCPGHKHDTKTGNEHTNRAQRVTENMKKYAVQIGVGLGVRTRVYMCEKES